VSEANYVRGYHRGSFSNNCEVVLPLVLLALFAATSAFEGHDSRVGWYGGLVGGDRFVHSNALLPQQRLLCRPPGTQLCPIHKNLTFREEDDFYHDESSMTEDFNN